MNFGVPSKKQRREEKYPDLAVATLSEDRGKGTAKTLSFNTKACEELGLPEKKAKVAFSFDNDEILIMNADQNGIPEQYGISVTKTEPRRVSQKKTYEYIAAVRKLDVNQENEFVLVSRDSADGEPNVMEMIVKATYDAAKGPNITTADGINEQPLTNLEDVDFGNQSEDEVLTFNNQ